jgi:low temperature requirement protein LtrA
LFLPIWRVWDNLRSYCINYYTDDMLQRNFMVWVLVLSVLYGVNAPYALVREGGNSLKLLIGIYLVIRVSFLVAQGYQCVFLPFLRKLWFFKVFVSLASGALWIGAIYAEYPNKITLLVVANFIEHPINVFLLSPAADRLLTPGWKREVHVEHYIERYEGFFIIILGEGVFRLIEGSPSGMGITGNSGAVIASLIMYYLLHWLYFNGDRTKTFVHALRRTWWKPVLWQM